MSHDRWRRYWWDDALDDVDAWAHECVRRAEETYEPSIQQSAAVSGPDMDPRIDTVWDEQAEDRLVRRHDR